MNLIKLAVVINDVAPLRKSPSDDSERVDEVLLGMSLSIISSANGWYYAKTFYDYEGYINEKDIIPMEIDEFQKWKQSAEYYVIQSVADILKDPKYNSPIIKTVTRGAVLCCTGEYAESWCKVLLPDGQEGWMKEDFLKKKDKHDLKEEEVIRKSLVETAKLYLNTQYRWGGKTPMGIDCSGLCFMSYLLNEFIIYRDAVLKDKYMKKIHISEVKPGDLIFFPGHVAMYIGNDEYIHSNAKSHCVSINSLDAKAYNFREDLVNSIVGVGSIFG